jgi:hypothetical protein
MLLTPFYTRVIADFVGPTEPTSPKEKKPVSLSTRKTRSDLKVYQDRVKQRQNELKWMQRYFGNDQKAIKKMQQLLKRAQRDLAEESVQRPKEWHSVEGLYGAAEQFWRDMGGDETYEDWYDRHRPAIEDIYGPDRKLGGGPEAFYKILAAMSPRNKVMRNMSMAFVAYQNWKKAGFPSGETGFRFTQQNVPGAMEKSHLMNMNRILRGEPLSGMKVPPFERNLQGDVDQVTIDMWMGILFFGHATPSDDEIKYAQKVIRQYARRMGKTPRFVQGLLWEMVMKRWGEPNMDFKRALEIVLGRQERGEEIMQGNEYLKKLRKQQKQQQKEQQRAGSVRRGRPSPGGGEHILPMTARNRRATLSLDTPVDDVVDALQELLEGEFGSDLEGRSE